MVVASGGWVQNASFPTGQSNTNLSMSAVTQDNKMTPKGILICRENSDPFQERTLSLDQPVKIGRSVARARATPSNAIFDCKVLSRNHAVLWYSAGKFYLQDTRSSNGTFINNQRLSSTGLESVPKEVCSGDIVQFGVDVMESTKKVTHGCIVATLKLYLPDGKEAKASLSTSVSSPASNASLEDLYKLNQVMQEASRREEALCSKLGYLQQLVENTRKAANQSWQALIAEDRLLSWVDTVESQLVVYSKNFTEDKIRNELVKLHEDKAHYQNAAKETLQKILQEKLEVTQRLVQLEGRLSETEEECQSLHNVAKHTQTELQEVSAKYTEAQKKLQETTNKLTECEETLKDTMQNAVQEKLYLLKRLASQSRVERNLHARLREWRLDSLNIYKQITALKNYMQTLHDMNSKLVTGEMLDSKDEENPIEAINVILNKLNSIHVDNIDMDSETLSNLYSSKSEQDNQINLQEIDSNQLKNSDLVFTKDLLTDSIPDNDNLTEYILPPPSRRTLVNGNVNIENMLASVETDINSDATDDTCSITSDDISEKSVIEVKREDYDSETIGDICVPHKMEVRFNFGENSEEDKVYSERSEEMIKESEVVDVTSVDQLPCDEDGKDADTHYGQTEQSAKKYEIGELASHNLDRTKDSNILVEMRERKEDRSVENRDLDEDNGEHLEGEYLKTLKPSSKNDAIQHTMHSKEYILQTLIGSLDSLKDEDSLEGQQVVKKELEELRDWLVHEPFDVISDKLKDLYYHSKNEVQRMQEVNEELVILKEKYNKFVEEKTELTKKYTTLKAQCGDLLNTTYTVPIHYVAPIALMLLWLLLEKIF
ncbi:hypothetical protein KM043_007230 [Ampulex compressa]|nr:hypothetical protein KM043_007230 [Ampulex compressa]